MKKVTRRGFLVGVAAVGAAATLPKPLTDVWEETWAQPAAQPLEMAPAAGGSDAVLDLLKNGYLRIYDGFMPADADEPITSQVMLAELRFGPVVGADDLRPTISAGGTVENTGMARWARGFTKDEEPVLDCSVGTSGNANIVLNTQALIPLSQVDLFMTMTEG